jgi:hypothetical protein
VTWVMWNLILVRLETVLVLVQDKCMVRNEYTIGKASRHSMGLRGDEAQVEAQFGLFGDSANLDARLVHGLRRTYRKLENSIRGTQWNS